MHSILRKIVSKLKRLRMQPIRVFCIHQVIEQFDPATMWKCDWMPVDTFKERIEAILSEGYTFISLAEANRHLVNDRIRLKKYAVLTMDDAGNCIMDIMDWLAQKQIPIALFIPATFITRENTKHKCGTSLTKDQFDNLLEKYASYISIANHGYNHIEATAMTEKELKEDLQKAELFLSNYPGKIPFYAYPGGKHTKGTDEIVHKEKLIPVYCDGGRNYTNEHVIHRESL